MRDRQAGRRRRRDDDRVAQFPSATERRNLFRVLGLIGELRHPRHRTRGSAMEIAGQMKIIECARVVKFERQLDKNAHTALAMLRESIPHHHQPVVPGFAAPGFAGPAEHLANAGAALVARKCLVGFRLGVEALDGIGLPIGCPDLVLVVDIDRISAALALRHWVMRPGLLYRIVLANATCIPEARPQIAFRIRPDAARARALARRFDNRGLAGSAVDLCNVVAAERRIPDVAAWRDRDTIGTVAARGSPGVHLAALGIDAAIDAALSGEPVDAFLVEGSGIEIGARKIARKREYLDGARDRIEPHDCVLSAVGEPSGASRTLRYAMGSRPRPERNMLGLAGLGIEYAQHTFGLARIPDRPVRARRNVMRKGPLRELVVGDLGCRRRIDGE